MMNNKQLTTKDNIPKTSTELVALVTDTRQRQFLDTYAKCNRRISKTAEAIGVNECTIFYWINHYDSFSQAFQALKRELDATRTEDYLENVRSIAFDPNVPPQSRLLGSFFELKALDDRYKDKLPASNVNIGEIIVHSSIPRPKYDQIEGEYTEISEPGVT